MTDLLIPRRKFLTGLFGLVAAPAVVKAANIMPVKAIEPQWFANDGIGLVSMVHPVPIGFRRLTLDDYYTLGILPAPVDKINTSLERVLKTGES